jgi:ATP-dependent DNA helicase RecQ
MQNFSVDQLTNLLATQFGYTKFKPGQLESIHAVLNGKNVLSILPTGGGKSLVYQMLSVLLEGVVIVVSPLISLMKDQGKGSDSFQISYSIYNSSIDELEQIKAISKAVNKKINLLYLSPERATSSYFINMSLKMKPSCIVIDEAHCISQWGQDFRPEYMQLKLLIEKHPNTPILALTATATKKVVNDIQKSLNRENLQVVQTTFFRNNLKLFVKPVSSDEDKLQFILENLKEKNNGRVLIYCATRKATEVVYSAIKQKYKNSGLYHAGLELSQREAIQENFKEGKLSILIATNAFGMGIDLPNIYTVIHYQVPGTVENYYQECGRAGRDGNLSNCILLYKSADTRIQKALLSKKKNKEDFLQTMQDYVFYNQCRIQYICQYFGESVHACGLCDNCTNETDVIAYSSLQKGIDQKKESKNKARSYLFDSTKEHLFISVIEEYQGKFGSSTLAGVLKGSKSKSVLRYKLDRSKYYGSLKDVPMQVIQERFTGLVEDGTVKKIGKKYPKLATIITKQKRVKNTDALSMEEQIIRELKKFVNSIAKETNQKKYMILQNTTLRELSQKKPCSIEELLSIKGIGVIKKEKFGKQIISIIRKVVDL